MRYAFAIMFLAAIVAANELTSRVGLVDLGLGISVAAGTFLAGLTFVLRDYVDELGGRSLVVVLILLGAVLSFVLSEPRLAVASGTAFLVSESLDFAAYRRFRPLGFVTAGALSNVVGSVVDTLVFLPLAGFPISEAPGQIVVKLSVTVAFVLLVGEGVRVALLRQPLDGRNP